MNNEATAYRNAIKEGRVTVYINRVSQTFGHVQEHTTSEEAADWALANPGQIVPVSRYVAPRNITGERVGSVRI